MSRKVDYFKAQEIAPLECAPGLYGFNVRYVPIVLSAVEARKGRSFWASDADLTIGYNALCAIQEAILCSAADQIVNNIIAMRGIDPLAPRNEVTGVPIVSVPGSTLIDQWNNLRSDGVSAGDWLNYIYNESWRTAEATSKGLLDELGEEALLSVLLGII